MKEQTTIAIDKNKGPDEAVVFVVDGKNRFSSPVPITTGEMETFLQLFGKAKEAPTNER